MAAARIPVEIVSVPGQDGTSKMIPQVSLQELVRHPHTDMQEEMDALARRYLATIKVARDILSEIAANRRETGHTDAKLYWELGKMLQQFIDDNETSPLFLNGIKAHFTRDLGISAPSWKKILRLYHLVPSKDIIDNSRKWKFYRDAPTRVIQSIVADAAARIQRPLPRQEPPGIGQVSRPTVQKRDRVEVHLPREALEKLGRLAERLGLPANRSAAIVRALLLAILREESRPDMTLRQLLQTARDLAKESSRPHIRRSRNR